MTGYIYLLQEREFIRTNEPIYKIGRTIQEHLKRFNQYPKGSKLILQQICDDCDKKERLLINMFKDKYIQIKDRGFEYFEGNVNDMTRDIYAVIFAEQDQCHKIEDNIPKKEDINEHILELYIDIAVRSKTIYDIGKVYHFLFQNEYKVINDKWYYRNKEINSWVIQNEESIITMRNILSYEFSDKFSQQAYYYNCKASACEKNNEEQNIFYTNLVKNALSICLRLKNAQFKDQLMQQLQLIFANDNSTVPTVANSIANN